VRGGEGETEGSREEERPSGGFSTETKHAPLSRRKKEARCLIQAEKEGGFLDGFKTRTGKKKSDFQLFYREGKKRGGHSENKKGGALRESKGGDEKLQPRKGKESAVIE